MRRLELGHINIKDIQFGPESKIEDGVLYVDEEAVKAIVLEDERIKDCKLDIARPGESVRITPVKDVIEPRVKVEGRGGIFPGVISKVDTVGEGKTYALKGMAVVTAGKIVGFQEGIIDMTGPGAEYTPFSKLNNLVVVCEPVEGIKQHDYEPAVRFAGFRVAVYLGELARELTPDKTEVFETYGVMEGAEKFPGLCTPDDSYHGITYAEKFGKEGAFITKCTSQLMRDLGCAQSPQSAFILNLGLESLHVRMPRHVENGQAVAEFLEQHDKVEFVNYPTLPSNKYYETAKKYLPSGGCGVVSFELKGGRAAAEKFMKNLKLAAIETHVADAKTCCLNPATSTHRQMNDEQLAAAGVPAGLIRISCGLEDKNDLIADIAQALDAI